MITTLIKLTEKGLVPDFFIRLGIRKLSKVRLDWANSVKPHEIAGRHQDWVEILKKSPIALVPEKANEQHYEVPPAFFKSCLGPHLKYSSGYWPMGVETLEDSEEAMLSLSCERAQIKNGDRILELGCGWGSLTCYMAKKFPKSQITAVSNSKDQKDFILQRCKEDNLENVQVITADMNDFDTEKKFNRVVSIEMFEHMRNYQKLLSRISNFLESEGTLFVHIFTHEYLAYPFEDQGDGDWMAREFFSGGMMPSHNLLLYFQDDLKINSVWRLSGTHYEKTSLAWLQKMDQNRREVLDLFADTYGKENAKIWFQRWRIFFMSCEQLFGYNRGREWGVSHYLFLKP